MMANTLIRIDRMTGQEQPCSRERLVKVLRDNEPVEEIDSLLSAIACGRHVYATAGFVYRTRPSKEQA